MKTKETILVSLIIVLLSCIFSFISKRFSFSRKKCPHYQEENNESCLIGGPFPMLAGFEIVPKDKRKWERNYCKKYEGEKCPHKNKYEDRIKNKGLFTHEINTPYSTKINGKY